MKWARLARLAWHDTRTSIGRLLLLGIGVAVGVAALSVFFALGAGVEAVVVHRVLGVLPDQIVVEPSTMTIGPMKMSGGGLDDAAVARIAAIPGVRATLRRVRVPLPAHLNANISGRSFYTDILLEAVDPDIVGSDVASGAFAVRPPGDPIPAVLPSVMMDILNLGFSVNTGLPQMNEQLIVGRHFTLNLGSSSFKWGPTVTARCEVVGISPRIGVGGPAIPLGYLPDLDRQIRAQGGSIPMNGASSVTVLLRSPADLEGVSRAVHGLGLSVPQETRAAQVTASIRGVALAMSLFGLLVLAVAGTGIANGLGLMVKDESGEIGLFRAVGASYQDVLGLYLMRAGCIGAVGGVVGLVVALVATGIVNGVAGHVLPGLLSGSERLAALGIRHLLAAFAFGLAASLLAGFLPARQAARINPAEALRER